MSTNKDNWFIYEVKAHPNHTDYAGVVWHGSYIAWMEEARVEYLRNHGIEYSDLVNLGFELPVVELSLRYHKAVRMGMTAHIKTRIAEIKGVKIHWDYKIESPDLADLYVSGRVTLVGIDREKGKIVRKLPPQLQDVLEKMLGT